MPSLVSKYVPSTFNQNYSIGALFPVVDITTGTDLLVRPHSRTLMIDFLDQSWVNMMNQIRQWTNDVWTGQKWTSMCFNNQGTTSLWMFNLAFNGLGSPLQLQPGMVLRFPLVSEINRLLTAQNANNGVGRLITI